MACSSSVIPRSAVELLFAEDLIKRILGRHTGEQFKTWRAAPYRDFIFNAFSDDIGEAVDFIDMMLEWEVDEAFSAMVDEHQVNRDAFVNYALHLEGHCFRDGFDADNFLHFCVTLVSLAVDFDLFGVPLALELALFFVVKVMTSYDLFEGGWDTLNAVARKYVERKEDFCSVLTPDVSDDELSMNVLEDDAENEAEYYVSNEEGGFAINQEVKPKDESDLETMNSSGLKSDLETMNSSGLKSDLETMNSSGLKSDLETMNSSGLKSDLETTNSSGSKSELPTSLDNMAEGYALNKGDGFGTDNEQKPNDKADRQKTDLLVSKLNTPANSENEAEEYTSNVDCESTITLNGKIQIKPDSERMDLSGSKLPVTCLFRDPTAKNLCIPLDL